MSQVELTYMPDKLSVVRFVFPHVIGMTVADVLSQSNIVSRYPETHDLAVGIFSKKVTRDTVLQPGARVEIYRPLLSDPKEKRRQRARQR